MKPEDQEKKKPSESTKSIDQSPSDKSVTPEKTDGYQTK